LVVDPMFVALAAAGVAVLAGLAALGLLTAPVDRRCRLPRVAAMAAAYLAAEVVVILACFALWLAAPFLGDGWEPAHAALLRRVLAALVATARTVVGFRVEIVEPPKQPGPTDGCRLPLLVLSRHAGAGDSFVLVHLLLSRYRILPRIVLAARMRLDPAIDILLGRLGACFLHNDGRSENPAGRVRACAGALTGREALVIFPEGANYTERRRRRLIERLRARGHRERVRVAEELSHVLPPRPAGVLAALDAGTAAGTVVVAHTGLDGLTTPAAVWRALPLAVPLQLRWWWVPAADTPTSGAARTEWLTMHWAVLDAWIDSRRPG
jgi:1-acyl-sn-glycerol-3-phosphate acyltransferase